MPTSERGISTRIASRSERPTGGFLSRGFSLLELLVVIAIIGIFVGVVTLSTDLVNFERRLEQQASRLGTLLTLVSEEALMQSRDYGLLFTEDSYHFFYFDYDAQEWLVPADDRLLVPHTLDNEMVFELWMDDLEVQLDPYFAPELEDTIEPHIMIFSSGEVTPFEAVFRREETLDPALYEEFRKQRVALTVEFDGTTEIERDDDEF